MNLFKSFSLKLIAAALAVGIFAAPVLAQQEKDFSITVSDYGPNGGYSASYYHDDDYEPYDSYGYLHDEHDQHNGYGYSNYGNANYGYSGYGAHNQYRRHQYGYRQPQAFRRYGNDVIRFFPADVWCAIHRARHIHVQGDYYGGADWPSSHHRSTYSNYGFVPSPRHRPRYGSHHNRPWRRHH